MGKYLTVSEHSEASKKIVDFYTLIQSERKKLYLHLVGFSARQRFTFIGVTFISSLSMNYSGGKYKIHRKLGRFEEQLSSGKRGSNSGQWREECVMFVPPWLETAPPQCAHEKRIPVPAASKTWVQSNCRQQSCFLFVFLKKERKHVWSQAVW